MTAICERDGFQKRSHEFEIISLRPIESNLVVDFLRNDQDFLIFRGRFEGGNTYYSLIL